MRRGCSTLIALALLAVACGGAAAQPSPDGSLQPSEPFTMAEIELVGPDAQRVVVPVYVADTPEERSRGLMERDHLPPDAGMLFLYPEGDLRTGGYWMKNTRIPLSIAFYGPDGDVRRVLDMQPCQADPCPTYEPGVTYAGALEVNQGYFAEIGAGEGWTVAIPPDVPPAQS
jgi:uncharacterized membrane protein (UPF0127 family)